jgi:hypothetical protein
MSRLPNDPSVLGKLRFAAGARLGSRYLPWVRHDLTDAGWRWRMGGRHLPLVLPPAVAFGLLPGPAYLHWMLPALIVAPSVFLTAAYGDEIRAARLRQHGLPVPVDNDLGRPPNER